VDAGHEETLQDDVVELGIGTTGQETVELKQNKKITLQQVLQSILNDLDL
jgi:hypothetical protein